jgi:hypothetical protein
VVGGAAGDGAPVAPHVIHVPVLLQHTYNVAMNKVGIKIFVYINNLESYEFVISQQVKMFSQFFNNKRFGYCGQV